jgi:predicted GNAT superfamily acetyltransferase
MSDGGIEIRVLTTAAEMAAIGNLFQQVWGSPTPLVELDLLQAISHSGGYVCGAFDHDRPIGASFGFLGRYGADLCLHSHVTGILPGVQQSGLGRLIKEHQREWAADQDIPWITWTFDPLVRRNAWFNIAVLGADVDAYLPSFYGEMTDAINAGDESDRLLMAWDVAAPLPTRPREGDDVTDPILVPTPADVVELRRTDPQAVAAWRSQTREALTSALATGGRVLGFTRDGAYVIGSAS